MNGPPFALNCDLIERIEETPDTVVTLVDGKRLLVREDIAEIMEAVRRYRAGVIALANQGESDARVESGLRLVSSDVSDATGPKEVEPWTR
ncbi:MAG: flagellar FlbD family protein [Acidimicrobiia bacterium]